jgi:hypothetical protein
MRTAIANHSRLTGGLAAATSIVLIPSLAAASTLPDEGEAVITVLDEGDPNHRVLLSGPLTPGTVADTTTNYDVDMSMVGSGFPIFLDLDAVGAMTRTTEVLSVDKAGAYTARETITSFELTMESGGSSDPEDLDVDGNGTTDLSPLIDVPLVVEYGEDGVLTNAEADSTAATSSVTPEQEELIEGLVEDGWGTEGFAVLMPTIPVGEGAVWTATEATNPASLDLPIALRLTLISLDGNNYVVEFTIEGDIADFFESQEEEGQEVTGDMTLTGTITGDASSPLDQTLSLDLLMDMTFAEDDASFDMDATIGIDHTSTTR